MKRLLPWAISAVAGLLCIFFLNSSPLARQGFGLELPFGWTIYEPDVCGETTEFCGVCDISITHAVGIPLAFSRPNKLGQCGLDSNAFAVWSNAGLGAGLGLGYFAFAGRFWIKNHHRTK